MEIPLPKCLKAMVPSRKGGRGVFFKGHGAFSNIWSGASLCKKDWAYPCKCGRAYPSQKVGPDTP
ncbi:hypothetical protein Pyn_34434 [Prunus yedoensis var. nudiflora]|uniref:Uncharacterized protein n=1 Tax=Prunus yedoensis var. nudiflora TaxID=2094558 RepID=A0A314YFG4_PRUYE|nr:hypothetical protein Pyn_34434 [Prunus yedoensis var. nudiflora]